MAPVRVAWTVLVIVVEMAIVIVPIVVAVVWDRREERAARQAAAEEATFWSLVDRLEADGPLSPTPPESFDF